MCSVAGWQTSNSTHPVSRYGFYDSCGGDVRSILLWLHGTVDGWNPANHQLRLVVNPITNKQGSGYIPVWMFGISSINSITWVYPSFPLHNLERGLFRGSPWWVSEISLQCGDQTTEPRNNQIVGLVYPLIYLTNLDKHFSKWIEITNYIPKKLT